MHGQSTSRCAEKSKKSRWRNADQETTFDQETNLFYSVFNLPLLVYIVLFHVYCRCLFSIKNLFVTRLLGAVCGRAVLGSRSRSGARAALRPPPAGGRWSGARSGRGGAPRRALAVRARNGRRRVAGAPPPWAASPGEGAAPLPCPLGIAARSGLVARWGGRERDTGWRGLSRAALSGALRPPRQGPGLEPAPRAGPGTRGSGRGRGSPRWVGPSYRGSPAPTPGSRSTPGLLGHVPKCRN